MSVVQRSFMVRTRRRPAWHLQPIRLAPAGSSSSLLAGLLPSRSPGGDRRRHRLAGAGSGGLGVGSVRCEADTRSLAGAGMSWPYLVEGELLGDGREQLSDVLGSLGRCLEEEKAGFLGIRLGVGGRDSALVGLLGDQIQLVSSEGDDDVLVRLALQLLDPSLGLVK